MTQTNISQEKVQTPISAKAFNAARQEMFEKTVDHAAQTIFGAAQEYILNWESDIDSATKPIDIPLAEITVKVRLEEVEVLGIMEWDFIAEKEYLNISNPTTKALFYAILMKLIVLFEDWDIDIINKPDSSNILRLNSHFDDQTVSAKNFSNAFKQGYDNFVQNNYDSILHKLKVKKSVCSPEDVNMEIGASSETIFEKKDEERAYSDLQAKLRVLGWDMQLSAITDEEKKLKCMKPKTDYHLKLIPQ